MGIKEMVKRDGTKWNFERDREEIKMLNKEKEDKRERETRTDEIRAQLGLFVRFRSQRGVRLHGPSLCQEKEHNCKTQSHQASYVSLFFRE